MLRCPPSEIVLTAADIHETTQRLAFKRSARSPILPASVHPRVVQGAQRSWHEAVTHPIQQPKQIAGPPPCEAPTPSRTSRGKFISGRFPSSPNSTAARISANDSSLSGNALQDFDRDEVELVLTDHFARKFSLQSSIDGAADSVDQLFDVPATTIHPDSAPYLGVSSSGPVEFTRSQVYQASPSLQRPCHISRQRRQMPALRFGAYSSDLVDDCLEADELTPLLSHGDHPPDPNLVSFHGPSAALRCSPRPEEELKQTSLSPNSLRKHSAPIFGAASLSSPNLGFDIPVLSPVSLRQSYSDDDIHPTRDHAATGDNDILSSPYPSAEVPLLEMLQDRLSPLERLEHDSSRQMPDAPSVASFSVPSSSSSSASEMRLPTFESPDQHSKSRTPGVLIPTPIREVSATPSPTFILSTHPTPVTVIPDHTLPIGNGGHTSSTPSRRRSTIHRDFTPVIPPRVGSRRHGDDRAEGSIHPEYSPATARSIYRHTHAHVRPMPQRYSPTFYRRVIPSWQLEQENSSAVIEDMMAVELEQVRTRREQSRDGRMDETPPRQGRFERIANGPQRDVTSHGSM